MSGRTSYPATVDNDDDGAVSIRVLVVDDHPVVLDGLAAVLGRLDGFEVAGTARTGREAVREAQLLRPDVVLIDVRMPDIDGVEATRLIRASVPATAVLILTMYDDDRTLHAAMRAGARGYLLKDADHVEIASALRGVVSGQAILAPGIASRVSALLDGSLDPRAAEHPFPRLTERERSVLDLLASGRRTSEIAAELYLSPKTVSNQLTAIFAKLGVSDRTGAVIKAREAGLGGARARDGG